MNKFKIAITLAAGLMLATAIPSFSQTTNDPTAGMTPGPTPGSLTPTPILGINVNFLTNLPTVKNFAAMKAGIETGVATENSQVANYIKGDFYYHTNWMFSGEIQNAPVSTVLSSLSLYPVGYRLVWQNAELYAQGAVRRTFSNGAVPPSWQGGALSGASWFPVTGGNVAVTASFALLTSPIGNGFNQTPNIEIRAGMKVGF